ncbi:MAG: energy transducer TonB [Acidobacteriota bacterium]
MFAETLPDAYTPLEVARAAGVAECQVRDLVQRGAIRLVTPPAGGWPTHADGFIDHAEALRVVRALRAGQPVATSELYTPGPRLASDAVEHRRSTVPLALSTSLHGLVVVLVISLGGLGLTSADERTEPVEPNAPPVRLVFLVQPGPGGGGGGGGLKMPTPPPQAKRRGTRKVSSPIPARRVPPPPTPPRRPVERPPVPLEARTIPPVMAPVAPAAADNTDREGLLKEVPATPATPPSRGSGDGGGTGSGRGTGLGEGTGPGIGPGEGGGTGGGPYRPGSGVDPPRLVKEVRADYTDAARRAGVVGEVVLEIVVRRDGTVGDIRVLQRLDAGLDQRAADAVRQWRFSPARLKGTPVDVIVEVSVEFKLR